MANYSVTNSTTYATQPANVATYTAQAALVPSNAAFTNTTTISGLKRFRIYDVLVGTNGTPADNFVEWSIDRVTAMSTAVWVGSVSSVSSKFALDVADQGFSAFATVNCSAPSSTAFTVGLQTFYVGVNQRASYRWVASPGGEIVSPGVSSATGLAGLALSSRSAAYTGTSTVTVMFSE